MSIDAIGGTCFEEREDWAPEAPVLPSPRANMIYDLISVHRETEARVDRITRDFGKEIQYETDEIERLSEIKQKALTDYAHQVKSRNSWGVLGKVAQYITSAASIAFGIACMATGVGSAPGALLIAAGGLGLINGIMTDTGAWKAIAAWFTKSEELQVKLSRWFDFSCFVVSAGLGIAGGVWAYKAGAFAAVAASSAATKVEKISSGIAMVGTVVKGSAQLGEATADRKVGNTSMIIKQADANTTLLYQEMSEKAKYLEEEIQRSQAFAEDVQKAVDGSRINF